MASAAGYSWLLHMVRAVTSFLQVYLRNTENLTSKSKRLPPCSNGFMMKQNKSILGSFNMAMWNICVKNSIGLYH